MTKRRASKLAASGAAEKRLKRLVTEPEEPQEADPDLLTPLPSAVLRHCILAGLQFEELMTDARLVSRSLRAIAEATAVEWMQGRFSDALATFSREQQKLLEEENKADEQEETDAVDTAAAASSSPSPSSSSSSPSPSPSSSSSPSPSPEVAAPPTCPVTSLTVGDAAWLNRQLSRWAVKALCNRDIRLEKGERELLRLPAKEVAKHYLVPRPLLASLQEDRVLQHSWVKGNRLAHGYWLMDVLHLVFRQHGHVSAFLPLRQAREERKAESRQGLLAERKQNKNRMRLKVAIEAEGVKWRWSDWEWLEKEGLWKTRGVTLEWLKRGGGRWRLKTKWAMNPVEAPRRNPLALKVHAALEKLGFFCHDCASFFCHNCYSRHSFCYPDSMKADEAEAQAAAEAAAVAAALQDVEDEEEVGDN